ncbi:hypothetical protein SPRG_09005 [Saprolegnia parasitica CBS 223.65]|uniref:BZIP domain-containing protein n=1 Tax=Saprolegnia parasitica (strain CBS 223.65) TaxID=695850 RepID=A0A067CGR3_SAPPC|nr:hypothetical protein SPRG_09005 [Saprolegnia parasitica CBS 223.65]KDO25706.1 hypothetical protein SPRG_09005 [Saprolegnia parasitica CBS 223.65]|eukprot:XP_012203516.1 hypothetical protein SPRG_09005 [Saprolegnia parasitica CBS 223.65]
MLPVVAGVHVEVDGLDGLSKDEKRRVLNRVRQREYRRLDLAELQLLRRRVADLEKTWTALTVHGKRDRMRMLPWKDIAHGLRDETQVAVDKNRRLRDQLEYYTTMARVLGSWVARLSPTMQASMPPTPPNWHSVALPADAGARGLAMDWLMTRLYHNVDGTFEANAFPVNSLQDFSDINIYLDDGKFQFVVRSQRVVHASLAYVDGVYGAFCDDVAEIGVENSTGNWVSRIDQEELEGQNLVYGHQTLIKGVEQHYLCRRYTCARGSKHRRGPQVSVESTRHVRRNGLARHRSDWTRPYACQGLHHRDAAQCRGRQRVPPAGRIRGLLRHRSLGQPRRVLDRRQLSSAPPALFRLSR